ncbi:9897_t:CDS:1 [Acaulospora morrowiae]|uniref:9897_t:CDS:1 n=1 Tax=Acaulospora morrowiae TaxID=94023 RepID=A0A9N9DXH5_9GLOM|nr:9897_t:CDS:1 [Acaulospora morrowiae]
MPQIKQSRELQARYPKNSGSGRVLNNGNVVHAILDARGERLKVVVRLNDGVEVDFPVPTSKEIRDRFFYKKAKSSDKPARPPNKFFIFRTMFQGAVDAFKLQVPIVSGIASEVWKKSSPEVKEVFTRLSQIAKTEHSEINPGYVYKPHRRQLKDTSSADNDVDSVQERPDDGSTTSSPCLSSNPSSPCTPTLPLWSATSSEHALSTRSTKNNESYISANLSLQSMSSNFHTNPYNEPYSTLHPQHQLTINFSYSDPTYIHHHHHHQINALNLIAQPDSYQYYQHSNVPYALINSTNDETLVDQQTYNSYRPQLISYGSGEEGDSTSSYQPMTYYPSVNHDSPPHFATNFTDMVNEASLIPEVEEDDDKTLLQETTQMNSPSSICSYDRNYSQRMLSFKYPQYASYLRNSIFPEYYRFNEEVMIKRLKEDHED